MAYSKAHTEDGSNRAPVGVKAASNILQHSTVGPYEGTLQIGIKTTDRRLVDRFILVSSAGGSIALHNDLERNDGIAQQYTAICQQNDQMDASQFAITRRDMNTTWMANVQPARDRYEQNMEAFVDSRGMAFFRAIRAINEEEELLVWYCDEYAMLTGIPTITPAHITVNKLYMCTKCRKTYEYPNPLKAHMHFRCSDTIHQAAILAEPFHLPILAPPTPLKQETMNSNLLNVDLLYPMFRYPDHRERPSPQNDEKTDPFPLSRHQISVHYQNNVRSQFDGSCGTLTPLKIDIAATTGKYRELVQPIQIFNHIHPSMLPADVPWHYYCAPYARGCFHRGSKKALYRGETRETNRTDNLRDDSMTSSFCDEPDQARRADESSDDDHSTSSVGLEREEFQYRIPDESEGEPLDLIPRHLYMSKSRNGHLCIYCGKVYSRKYGLKIHLRTHTGYKPLKCKFCSRPFGDPSNLNKHVRLHAEGDTPYRCDLCDKVLVRRRDLLRHIRSRHQNELSGDHNSVHNVKEPYYGEELSMDIKPNIILDDNTKNFHLKTLS